RQYPGGVAARRQHGTAPRWVRVLAPLGHAGRARRDRAGDLHAGAHGVRAAIRSRRDSAQGTGGRSAGESFSGRGDARFSGGAEMLRKGEEAKPLPDAQRVFEAQQPIRPAQAPAAAPAPGANTLRESASAVQGAVAVGGLAGRAAVSEAKERTPERWLADIRK